MKKTIGIFAHVDSGKTTFSEQILYMTGSIKTFGRTDKKTSSLDTDETERERGITVFSHQAEFEYNNNKYYLTDTPGHNDFFPEAERAVKILDYGILIIGDSVRSDTVKLFKLLYNNNIPCFIFVNKSDMDTFDKDEIFDDIKNKLGEDCFILGEYSDCAEFLAERDENFFEKYIDEGYSESDIRNTLISLIKIRKAFPVMFGSALKNIGIDNFLKKFDELSITEYNNLSDDFEGRVFKIRHDSDGKRIIFIKAIKGSINIKDSFDFDGSIEKVNEIRFYNGDKYRNEGMARAGDVFGVVGLKMPVCGDIITNAGIKERESIVFPAMEAELKILDGTDRNRVIEVLKILESEEPTLNTNTENNGICVNITGKIQLEILKVIFKNRFGIDVDFDKPRVRYAETIRNSVMGIGHYEPLRHYAEVQLRLEPLPRNSGIVFESECHVDRLSINYQNLIKTHVFEKVHKGVLMGAPVTDIKVVLTDGKSHLKHTEGGDFRQACYRAIRQGLMRTESILLEPFYDFEICAPLEFTGRIISDIQRLRGSFQPPENEKDNVRICGRGPVDTFMEYRDEIMIFTKGKAGVSFSYGGMEKCTIAESIIEKAAYDPEADVENTPNSVFCKKGAGFVVNWNEVEEYAHTLRK